MNSTARSLDSPSVVWAMAVIASVATLLLNGMPLVIDTLANVYDLNNDQLGLVASAYLVGNCLVVCTSLFWIRRVDWRRVCVGGTALGLVLLGVLAVAPTVATFNVCFFLFGGAMACCYAPVLAYWSDVTHPSRAVSIGILLQVAGAAIFVYAVPAWLVPRFGVRGLIYFVIASLLLSLLLVPLIPRAGTRTAVRPGSRQTSLHNALLPLVGLLIMSIYFTGFIGMWAFLGRIGTASGLSAEAVDSALSLSLLLGGTAVVVTSIIGNRFGYLPPLIVSLAVYAAFFTLTGSFQSPVWFMVALILFNFAANGALPYQLEIIAKSDRDGRYFVLLPAFQSAGAAAGPFLAGLMSVGGHYLSVYVMSVATIVVAWIGYFAIGRHLHLIRPADRGSPA